jgi:hypothetical protein
MLLFLNISPRKGGSGRGGTGKGHVRHVDTTSRTIGTTTRIVHPVDTHLLSRRIEETRGNATLTKLGMDPNGVNAQELQRVCSIISTISTIDIDMMNGNGGSFTIIIEQGIGRGYAFDGQQSHDALLVNI